jgi:hypothetical protein
MTIEKTLGFNNETPLPKNLEIVFVDSTIKIDITKIKAVEISPTANVRVSVKTGEVIQISLKSENEESVELWVKSLDGSWLKVGVITINNERKATLPPIQFQSSGNYLFSLNKPSTDNAKQKSPLNQVGTLQVLVK